MGRPICPGPMKPTTGEEAIQVSLRGPEAHLKELVEHVTDRSEKRSESRFAGSRTRIGCVNLATVPECPVRS